MASAPGRQPTTMPVTATMAAHTTDVRKSAAERPTNTAERHMGSVRKRSIMPSCRSVLNPIAVPMVEVVRFSARIPASRKST